MRVQWVIGLLVGLIAIIVGASLFAYTELRDTGYVSDDNAQVVAELVQVGSINAGRIKVINVDVGDAVVEGQAIATVELPSTISRSGTTDTAKIGFRGVEDLRVDVLAPTSGVIAARWANKGDVVPAGQRIVTLMDPRQVWIEANIDEDEIRKVHPGLSVEVRVDSLDRTLAGRVETVSPVTTATLSLTAEASTSRNLTGVKPAILVKIILDVVNPTLIPGASAKIKIRTR